MNRFVAEKQGVPQARTARRWRPSPLWLLPLVALGVVAWLVLRTYVDRGPTIKIRFSQVNGVEAGKTEVRSRGAKIGMVSELKLTPGFTAVDVTVRLDKSGTDAAKAGSQFWVVQPQVSASEIRGLGAIVSGPYIEAKPGQGPRTLRFMGLDQAPALTYERPGITVTLMTEKLNTVEKGTGVYYRGVQVGRVLSYELAPDAQTVIIRAHIDQEFSPLVCDNTKFWNSGGINANIGLLGANIQAESLKTMISGGIALATPDPPGPAVKNGAVFRLYEKGEDAWERWTPAINLPQTHPVNEPKTPERQHLPTE